MLTNLPNDKLLTLQSYNNWDGKVKLSGCSNNSLSDDVAAHDTSKDVDKGSMDLTQHRDTARLACVFKCSRTWTYLKQNYSRVN